MTRSLGCLRWASIGAIRLALRADRIDGGAARLLGKCAEEPVEWQGEVGDRAVHPGSITTGRSGARLGCRGRGSE